MLVTFFRGKHNLNNVTYIVDWPQCSVCCSDIQVQTIEELKQEKGYVKLIKKQNKELKELRKKHLKKVRACRCLIDAVLNICIDKYETSNGEKCLLSYEQVCNLSKDQKNWSSQLRSDTQRKRSVMENKLKRSIKKK